MVIQLDLDEEVIKLIEYIPDDLLSGILNKLIKDGIHLQSSIQANDEQKEKNTGDIARVVELMEQLAKQRLTAPVIAPMAQSTETTTSQEIVEKVEVSKPAPKLVSFTGLDDDELDDDFMSIMK